MTVSTAAAHYPGWWPDTADILDLLRAEFTYDDDGRSAGYLDRPWLTPLYDQLERHLDVRFTHTAFQAYRDGSACTDWHNDPPFDSQAILSLGATRTIALRAEGMEEWIDLDDGDLLYMPPGFQQEWEHRIPPAPEVTAERCSLVFRTVCQH